MPTKYDVVVQTKAPISKAIDYYSHPENLPKVHPDFVKDVKIISRDGSTVKLEQQMEMMGRRLKAVNTMAWDSANNKFVVNTLEGDGRGSKITIELKQVPSGTEVHYWAEMEFGALGFFIKGRAKESFVKVADEDAKALDAM